MSSSVPSPRRRLIRYLIAAIKSLSVKIREFLVQLIAPHSSEIVFLRIKKQSFQKSARIGHRWRIARAEPAVNILERFFLIVRRIFLQRLYHRVVRRNVDHLHFLDSKRHDLANSRERERFKR